MQETLSKKILIIHPILGVVFSFIEFSTSDSNSVLKNTLETYICTTVSKRIEFRD